MNDISKTKPGKITGGHLLARSMRDKGIKRIFSLCGGFINPVTIACLDHDIEIISARNEMEAGFLAVATSRLNREVSICLAEPSGFTNYISAVAEAYYAGDPVVFIGISSNSNNFDNKGFKELPQQEVVRPITKYSIEVNNASKIDWFFDKAFDIATQYPTGPVQLTIPTNYLFTGQIDDKPKATSRFFDPKRKKIHQTYPNPKDIDLVKTALNEASKPVLIAGAGVWHSRSEKICEMLTRKLNLPLFTPFTHIKPMDMSNDLHLGLFDYHQNPCSRLISDETDVILMLGGQLDFPINFGEAPLISPNTKLITVNPTARELSDNMLAEERICSGIFTFIESLLSEEGMKTHDGSWVSRLRQKRAEHNEKMGPQLLDNSNPIHPLRVCYDVISALNEEDFLIIDGGDIACWCEAALNIWAQEGKKIGGIIAPGPWEQMGTGPAFATAVKLARPGSRVVLVTGDGSIGLAPGFTPLETSIDYDAPVTIVIANNSQWGMIKNQQKAMWGRECGTSLRNIDYYKIFEAAGAYAELIEKPDDIEQALKRAWASGKTACLEIKTTADPSPMTSGLIDMRVKTSIE
tara:strand:- start:2089 stop:3825 length:1737 start_codon:yes stop_codon:yes gene_type:complete